MDTLFDLSFTHTVELPSGGKVYPDGNPLSKGIVEIRYPGAREQDILTNRDYIRDGSCIPRLVRSITIDENIKRNQKNLVVGDMSSIVVAARRLLHGDEYQAKMYCPLCSHAQHVTCDLSQAPLRTFDEDEMKELGITWEEHSAHGVIFCRSISLPGMDPFEIKFRLMTNEDEKYISSEKKRAERKKFDFSESEATYSRLILSVNGDSAPTTPPTFARKAPARLLQQIDEALKAISPRIDVSVEFECEKCSYYAGTRRVVPDANFFWPER